MTECPWCKFSPDCDKETCDFKGLRYERETIISRVRYEHQQVEKLKENPTEKGLREAFDKLAGINIMTARLQEDFGMTEDQVREECGLKKPSLMQKAKLAMMVKQFKVQRGSKR